MNIVEKPLKHLTIWNNITGYDKSCDIYGIPVTEFNTLFSALKGKGYELDDESNAPDDKGNIILCYESDDGRTAIELTAKKYRGNDNYYIVSIDYDPDIITAKIDAEKLTNLKIDGVEVISGIFAPEMVPKIELDDKKPDSPARTETPKRIGRTF